MDFGGKLDLTFLPRLFGVKVPLIEQIFEAIEADPETELVVDLPKQTITIASSGATESFEINGYKKQNLLNGFDDIDYLLNMKEEIEGFASGTPL